jgi:hypothetical protein
MERQADGHLPAMRGTISSWGTLSDSDLGLILQRLKPINDAIVLEGDKILGKIEEVYSLGSSNMKATLEAYLKADEAAYCEIQKVASEMGVQLPTYKDPRDSFSSLGRLSRRRRRSTAEGIRTFLFRLFRMVIDLEHSCESSPPRFSTALARRFQRTAGCGRLLIRSPSLLRRRDHCRRLRTFVGVPV